MRLQLWADGYHTVKNDDGVELPVCDACYEKGCYKKVHDPFDYGHGTDCKRMFKYPGEYTDHAQCCCYGHPDGDYMEG